MQEKQGSWLEVFKTFFWALVIAMVFRSFLFQPFHIPSGSMKPTLLIGDYLIVSKYSYGYSDVSFPFSPKIIDGRIWYTEPKRGDVVVFNVPSREHDSVFIKRLIGLPGDEIQVKKGMLYINGEKLVTEEDGQFKDGYNEIRRLVETLPNGVKHWTLYAPKHSQEGDQGAYNYFDQIDPDNTAVYKVPEGYFFMMGDNRDNSDDSRFSPQHGGPGFVAQKDLIGRAEIILFSSGQSWNPLEWSYDRFFTLLR